MSKGNDIFLYHTSIILNKKVGGKGWLGQKKKHAWGTCMDVRKEGCRGGGVILRERCTYVRGLVNVLMSSLTPETKPFAASFVNMSFHIRH